MKQIHDDGSRAKSVQFTIDARVKVKEALGVRMKILVFPIFPKCLSMSRVLESDLPATLIEGERGARSKQYVLSPRALALRLQANRHEVTATCFSFLFVARLALLYQT